MRKRDKDFEKWESQGRAKEHFSFKLKVRAVGSQHSLAQKNVKPLLLIFCGFNRALTPAMRQVNRLDTRCKSLAGARVLVKRTSWLHHDAAKRFRCLSEFVAAAALAGEDTVNDHLDTPCCYSLQQVVHTGPHAGPCKGAHEDSHECLVRLHWRPQVDSQTPRPHYRRRRDVLPGQVQKAKQAASSPPDR